MAVFDDKHQNAPDLPTDDEGHTAASCASSAVKGKGKQVARAPVSQMVNLESVPSVKTDRLYCTSRRLTTLRTETQMTTTMKSKTSTWLKSILSTTTSK